MYHLLSEIIFASRCHFFKGFALAGTIQIFCRKYQNWVVRYVTTWFILAGVHCYRKRWPHTPFPRKWEITKAFPKNYIQSKREILWWSVFLTKFLMGTKDLSRGSCTTCTTGWILIFMWYCSLEIKKPLLMGTELCCSLIWMDFTLRRATDTAIDSYNNETLNDLPVKQHRGHTTGTWVYVSHLFFSSKVNERNVIIFKAWEVLNKYLYI